MQTHTPTGESDREPYFTDFEELIDEERAKLGRASLRQVNMEALRKRISKQQLSITL